MHLAKSAWRTSCSAVGERKHPRRVAVTFQVHLLRDHLICQDLLMDQHGLWWRIVQFGSRCDVLSLDMVLVSVSKVLVSL